MAATQELINEMDRLGIEACRERRVVLAKRLEAALEAEGRNVCPKCCESMVEEAIERAEAGQSMHFTRCPMKHNHHEHEKPSRWHVLSLGLIYWAIVLLLAPIWVPVRTYCWLFVWNRQGGR